MPTSSSPGQFEQVVLAAVQLLQEKAYGRAIYKKVCELCREREVNLGGVYVTLERLTQKGFLKSWMADPTPERGGRAKRYYKLLPPGSRALQESYGTSERIHGALGDSWRIGKWITRRAK